MAGLKLSWIDGAEARRDVGAWIGARVALDAAYISHGEIQTALSPDGKTWIANVAERIGADLAGDTERGVLEARDAVSGARLAVGILHFELDAEAPFAVLEDIVVDPIARKRGVAKAMIAQLEAEAKRRGVGWVFLESGLGNHRAHAVFESAGYATLSKVFGKRLAD